MAKQKLLTMITIILLFSLSAFSQERQNSQIERQISESEIPEQWKQKYPQLFHPQFAKLQLEEPASPANNDSCKSKNTYKLGQDIILKLIITNISNQPVLMFDKVTFIHNHPKLFKNGQTVSYRKDAKESIEFFEDTLQYNNIKIIGLSPNETISNIINLNEWFPSLEVGSYELFVRHRFIWGGEWLDSPTIKFEVVP